MHSYNATPDDRMTLELRDALKLFYRDLLKNTYCLRLPVIIDGINRHDLRTEDNLDVLHDHVVKWSSWEALWFDDDAFLVLRAYQLLAAHFGTNWVTLSVAAWCKEKGLEIPTAEQLSCRLNFLERTRAQQFSYRRRTAYYSKMAARKVGFAFSKYWQEHRNEYGDRVTTPPVLTVTFVPGDCPTDR